MSMLVLQCRFCGRIRKPPSLEWVFADEPADVMGECSTCSKRVTAQAELRRRRRAREVARWGSSGVVRKTTRPFKGFEEGENDG